MPTFVYKDGKEVTFPDPKGENIRQIGKRKLAIQEHISKMKPLEITTYVDDIVYLLLDYWKAHKVSEPFKKLDQLVGDESMTYADDRFGEVFAERVLSNRALLTDFQTGDDSTKEVAKKKLKERGFIGRRNIEEL